MSCCQRCHGEGRVTNCADDLCQGDECIHGDYLTCPDCDGQGEWVDDEDFEEWEEERSER